MMNSATDRRLEVTGPLAELLAQPVGRLNERVHLQLKAPELGVAASADQLSEANETLQLQIEEVLRLLPDRRLVCRALLNDTPVVVKWFMGSDALKYQQREHRGVQILQDAELPTPKLLGAYRFVGPLKSAEPRVTGGMLVYAHLEGAQDLTDELLAAHPSRFDALWRLLAKMHNAGVQHNDLHFGNLMCTDNELWLLDGDAVSRPGTSALDLPQSVAGFVGLAAQTQRILSFEALQSCWRLYAAARELSEKAYPADLLMRQYRGARRKRIQHFQAKTKRDCTAFAKRRTLLGSALLDRAWLAQLGLQGDRQSEESVGREMLGWLDALPKLMAERDAQSGQTLKRGNTATVVAASFRGQPLIVKRYNNKSAWHRLRRLVRTDRGLNSWVYAQTLQFVGVATAPAVALLRTRFAGPSYLVMRSVEGVELNPDDFDAGPGTEPFEGVSQKLLELMDALAAEGLVHRDTKASNFLWDRVSGALTLIDLDAMFLAKSRRAAVNGHARDRRRLLRNFAATPDLQRRLTSLFD